MTSDPVIKKVKITAIIRETESAKTFLLEPLDGWQPVYKAGQFLTLVFYTLHGEKRRSYSLSSLPGEPLSITVKKVDNGEFSRRLVHQAQEGDVLYTSGISGMFLLSEEKNDATPFVFLAAGSGIVPCFALIRTLLLERRNRIILIYSNKSAEDTIFYKLLRQLQDICAGRLTVQFLFSNSNDLYSRRLSKWLLEILLEKHLGKDGANSRFYVCGPFDYMQTVEITLRVVTTKENIIKENFSTLPRLVVPEPPDKSAHTVTIHIGGNTHTVTVQYPKSILAAAKAKKIELPYSCEAGRCSSCVATCSSGEIWMAYNEVLTDKEVAKGRILTCQGFPVNGDAEITFD